MIASHLSRDQRLARAVKANPGMRVPGALHGFELGIRAILGQQVTVKAATTIAGRFAGAFGERLVTPWPALHRLTPSAAAVARASEDTIAGLGIVTTRARSILSLARAQESGALCLDSGARHRPEDVIRILTGLPGVGPWTAQYIAMRALGWPDAFPKEDIAVRNNLGGVSAKEAEALSAAWRPWRSYAVMHMWRM
jgi:AraC family transcriptional regulator of adaptative response / DNA-3-methyladenine glycosylase II